MMGTQTDKSRRVAIVTGGARGIGASIALRLASDGCDIALLDLDERACSDTLGAVQAAGSRAIAVAVDVADESSVARAVGAVAKELGPPLVLVNNAGILRERTLAKTTLADWDLVLSVNLQGTFLMSREVQAHMRAAKWGRIVNLSSTGALGAIGLASYSAAKSGVQGLTKTLSLELGRYGITVNAVAPGFTVTAMTAAAAERVGMSLEEMTQVALRDIPVGRVGHPDDIANAVAFFADERSSFVTGQVLYVAGGPRT